MSCEDQGYGLISDGCTNCRIWLPNGTKVGVILEERNGFWVCPSCYGSYGPVEKDKLINYEVILMKISDRSASIPHNLPVLPPRPTWYLAFGRPGTNSIFCHTGGHHTAVRGPNEGWSLEDVRTFNDMLDARNSR